MKHRLAWLAAMLFTLAPHWGCIDPSMMKPWGEGSEEEATDGGAVAAQPPDQSGGEAAPAGQANIAPQDVKTLVDARQARAQNPKLVEVENRINATDPVSAAGSAYFAITTRAQLLNMEHAIKIYKADNDNKHPPFAEFSRMLKDANVELKGLYRWQVYAYDDQTGELLILEDPDRKRELRGE